MGITGRGLLGQWGPHQAAALVVTRANPKTNHWEILLFRRESLKWVLPGGMQNSGELLSARCTRALRKDTSVEIDFDHCVSRGYVGDPRNPDNSWVAITVCHAHLTPEKAKNQPEPQARDATANAVWFPISEAMLADHPRQLFLYRSHADMLRLALASLPKE